MSSVLVTILVKEGYVIINDTHCTFLSPDPKANKLKSVTYIDNDYPVYDLTREFSALFELKNAEQKIALRISLNDLTSLVFTSSDSLLEILAIEHVFEIERILVNTYTILRDMPPVSPAITSARLVTPFMGGLAFASLIKRDKSTLLLDRVFTRRIIGFKTCKSSFRFSRILPSFFFTI